MDQSTFESIIDLFEAAEYEVRSYSGRGMYGSACLGVVCDNPTGLMVELAMTLVETTDDKQEMLSILEELKNPRVDSMGRSQIMYWEDIPWLAAEKVAGCVHCEEDDEERDSV